MKYRNRISGALHECFAATAIIGTNEPGVNWRRLRDKDQLYVIMSAKDVPDRRVYIRTPEEFREHYVPEHDTTDPVAHAEIDRANAERRLASAIHEATEGQWEPTIHQAFDILNAAIGPAPVLPLTPLVEIVTYVGDKPIPTHGGPARYLSWTLKVNGVDILMQDDRIRWTETVHPDYLAPPKNMLEKMDQLKQALGVPYVTEDYPKRYEISDRVMEKVFKRAGLTNLHDMQAVLNAVDQALATEEEEIETIRMQLIRMVDIAEERLIQLNKQKAPPALHSPAPAAWIFSLARAKLIDKDEYTDWGPVQVSLTKPAVPENSIRDLRALVYEDVLLATVEHYAARLREMEEAANAPTGNEVPNAWSIGTPVYKTSGYKYPGEVRAALLTKAGKLRYVIESTSAGTEGMLHIFAPDNLAVDE